MRTRPVMATDLAAIAEIERRWETRWFGDPETSAGEIGEHFDLAQPLADNSIALLDDGDDDGGDHDDDRLVAAAIAAGREFMVIVDPDDVTDAHYAALLEWCAQRPDAAVQAHSNDIRYRGVLETSGWRHEHSAFDLIRPVTADWLLAEPAWPEGTEVRDFDGADLAAVHHLIYRDAAWASVPGHPERSFDEWRAIFFPDKSPSEQQVLAWRGDRLVGVATGRIFDDGTGWIAQLAVATDERGQGLGRALLLAGLRRRRDAGATALGLAVQAENRDALRLYLDVGLQIEREWMEYRPTA